MNSVTSHNVFIDLFSGCGGFSLGLMKAGWQGMFAIEQNSDAFKTLKHNLVNYNQHNPHNYLFDWPEWLEIEAIEIKEFVRKYKGCLKSLRGKIHLIAGGPPCQGFSFAGRRKGNDPRNELFRHHLRIVDLIQPDFVLMENVQGIDIAFGTSKQQGIKRRGRPRKSYAKRIRDMLEKHGYIVQQHVIKAVDFGIPQMRPRYFTLGIRNDLAKGKDIPDLLDLLLSIREDFLRVRGLPLNRPVTAFEALSDLATTNKVLINCKDKESPSGFKEIVYKEPDSSYQKLMHGNMNGRPLNSMRLVNHRPQTVIRFSQILATCRKGVQLSQQDRIRLGIKKTSTTPLHPNLPSHTLTTLPDDLLHYAEPRVHTVREHARLQSFPDWFEFCGRFTTGGDRRSNECPRYTQVGNAVPPLLAEVVGEALSIINCKLKEIPSDKFQQNEFAIKGG